MAIRTIPARFPLVQQAELAYGRSMKADILRRFAQAQNFLWANVRRAASLWAYDGAGNFISGKSLATAGAGSVVPGWSDSLIADMPGGTYKGICVATFAIPAPQIGNTRIRAQGRANFQRNTGTAAIRVTLHEVDDDETFLGAYQTATLTSTSSTWDWSFDLECPNNRPVVGKVWFGGLLGSSTSGTGGTYDTLTIYSASVRWLPPDQLGAPTGTFDFEPVAPTAFTAGDSADVALLDQVRRGLVALGGSRGQTEILQSWFGEIERTTTSFLEVGRYKVYTSVEVGTIGYRLFLFKGDKDGQVLVKWNGTTKATIDVKAPQANWSVAEYSGTFTIAAGDMDAESVLSLEVKNVADSTAHGCMVIGVFAWEEAIDATGWPTVPSAFAPLDEGRLVADEFLVYDLEPNESARTGVKHLFANLLWLAKHRLRHLVADWRHRTLKRITGEDGTTASFPGSFWDWTPPGLGPTPNLPGRAPKNITVRGDLTVDDGWTRGAANHDSLDGFGHVTTGFSDFDTSGITTGWPAFQQYRGHGRRLSGLVLVIPSGLSMHASDGTATSTFRARARRVRPASMGVTFNQGQLGPTVEEVNWQNRGSLEVDWPSTGGLSLPIRSSSANVVDDYLPRWLPTQSKLSYATASGRVRGRLPIASIPNSQANVLEGTLFEVELLGLLAYEDPLSPAALALLS